jgi:tryptophan-rich sensory protein
MSFIPYESYKFILAPILLAIIFNGILFSFKLSDKYKYPYSQNKSSKYGYLIGIIWTIIFGFIGYTYYLLYKESKNYFTPGTIAIILYLIFSLSYPFITFRFTQLTDILNIISLFIALFLMIIVGNEYWKSANSLRILFYLMPLLVWLLFVNIFFGSFSKIFSSLKK